MTTHPSPPEPRHAWAIYLRATEEARRRGDRRTGTEHLLLALLDDPSIEVLIGVTLARARLTLETLDQQALAVLGVGPGTDTTPRAMRPVPTKPRLRDVARQDRLRLTPAAKRVLENASRSNRRRLYLSAPQILTEILTLEPPDPGAVLVNALGVDASELRRRLLADTPDG